MSEQKDTPILEALSAYIGLKPLRFHVPAHNGGKGAPPELAALLGPGVFLADVTELPGLDDLNNPTGCLGQAQSLAARAFGADRSYFLVNGATQGLQALMLAAGSPGSKVILPRNCHRSLVGALVISGLDPVFAAPALARDFFFATGVPAGVLAGTIRSHPDARAVVCLHPTYYGTVGSTAISASLAHGAGMPLFADEAHGSHFYFHRGFPQGALALGADAAVQSLHKTGGSLTQTSVLHIRGNLLKEDMVRSAARLIQTTSPSYVLMASLDAARMQLATRGKELLGDLLAVTCQLRIDLETIRGLEVAGECILDGDGAAGYDPSRLVIKVSGLGLTGYQAALWLAGRRLYVEMADPFNVVIVPGIGTTLQDCRLLYEAFKDLAVLERKRPLEEDEGLWIMPPAPRLMGVREAWFAPFKPVKLQDCAGRVSREWIAVYPPGIPALMPGEEITGDMVNYLIRVKKGGGSWQGPADPGLEYVRVVDP